MTPVFFHIPKCAGTYVIKQQLSLIHAYRKKKQIENKDLIITSEPGRNIEIMKGNQVLVRIIALDIKNICLSNHKFEISKSDITNFKINFEEINIETFNEVEIISVTIKSAGFRYWKNILKKIGINSSKKWTIIRDPFEVARSLYFYLNSSDSFHELTHGLINYNTFEDYLKSYSLSDSWLIRNILNLSDDKDLTDDDYLMTLEELKDFEIFNSNQVDSAIDKIFKECHNISINDININKSRSNTSNHTGVKLEDLDDETQNIFLQRTKYDRKLYKNYFD